MKIILLSFGKLEDLSLNFDEYIFMKMITKFLYSLLLIIVRCYRYNIYWNEPTNYASLRAKTKNKFFIKHKIR